MDGQFSPQSLDNLEPSFHAGLYNDHLFPVLVSRRVQLQRADPHLNSQTNGGASERASERQRL